MPCSTARPPPRSSATPSTSPLNSTARLVRSEPRSCRTQRPPGTSSAPHPARRERRPTPRGPRDRCVPAAIHQGRKDDAARVELIDSATSCYFPARCSCSCGTCWRTGGESPRALAWAGIMWTVASAVVVRTRKSIGFRFCSTSLLSPQETAQAISIGRRPSDAIDRLALAMNATALPTGTRSGSARLA